MPPPIDTSPPTAFLSRLAHAQAELDAGYAHLPPAPEPALDDRAAAILASAAARMHDNYPYAHPLYCGQMLKPPHPIARAAYALAMTVNPNNHALDGGRASSAMELEAVHALALMYGWATEPFAHPAARSGYLGHLTSSGTFANLEALWIAGQLDREAQTGTARAIAASDQAHYTHSRISAVLGLPFHTIATDSTGRMDLTALERALDTHPISTVVATLGTTAIGAVDPLDRILQLQPRYKFRIHVDSAYGGFFTLARNLDPATRAAYDAIPQADSLVVDPHKHGLQPYGCGAILFHETDPYRSVARFYKHDSPYTYFSSQDLHLGEVSLECSRAGASAVALWSTQQLLPYTVGGEFGSALETCREAALALHRRLAAHPAFLLPIAHPQLDILFWAVKAPTIDASSDLAHRIFDECARRDLHLALAQLPARYFPPGSWPHSGEGSPSVTCLRSVQMKPEHLAWGPEIWSRLEAATASSLNP